MESKYKANGILNHSSYLINKHSLYRVISYISYSTFIRHCRKNNGTLLLSETHRAYEMYVRSVVGRLLAVADS